MNINQILNTDSYKQFHHLMYPSDMTVLFSNFTPRKSRVKETNSMILFSLQYYIKEYLIKQWNETFFNKDKDIVIKEFKRFHKHFSFVDDIDSTHVEKLHDLGYLPIEILALPEGSNIPMKVPAFVVYNTHPEFAWLTNFLETAISNSIWFGCTSATTAKLFKDILDKYALETVGNTEFTQWQGHDFSMRGHTSLESAMLSGAGHLLSFTGSDTIPAVLFLEEYYNANIETELIASSVPATEHSVMCAGGKDDEIGTFKELLDKFPTGILSVVSDTWDLWKVCTEYLPTLKEQVLTRNGKLVIRPDSGNPVDIICGISTEVALSRGRFQEDIIDKEHLPHNKGVIELLWDIFGGTTNKQGYKVLDSHIGAIYGDSINLDNLQEILERLKSKGFASTNVVFGIGSFTYQGALNKECIITRDTYSTAIKSTYCELLNENKEIIQRKIFKEPITDDGMKKSAKGLLAVYKDEKGEYYLQDQVSWKEVNNCEFNKVFSNGKLLIEQSLSEIRNNIK